MSNVLYVVPKIPMDPCIVPNNPRFIRYTLPKVLVSQMERLYLGGVQNLESSPKFWMSKAWKHTYTSPKKEKKRFWLLSFGCCRPN
jgi:hypothetical protein